MNDSQWQSTFEKLKELVREQPENGEAWFQLATFFRDECDNPSYAVTAYEKARQYLPNQDLRLQLGAAYAKAGEFDRGISLLKEYLQEKHCAHGYAMLSLALAAAKRTDEAKKALELAISIEPTFEEPYFLMGELVRADSRETAISYYRQAITLDPNYQLAWRELGAALAEGKDTLEEGIDALCRAISLNPDDGWAHMQLAISHWKADRLKEADSEYRRAIEAFPDYPLFKEYYAQFLGEIKGTVAYIG